MRIDLVELMRKREVHHPSRIDLIQSKGNSELCIQFTGYPWWLENPEPLFDKTITLYFEGITDGLLDSAIFQADTFEEDLEGFDVRPLAEHEWAKGVHCDVYCKSPSSDPLQIFRKLNAFLNSVNCPHPPERYLNMGNSGSLNEFTEIAHSSFFKLCSGPEVVCQIVCDTLEASGTEFNMIRTSRDASGELICVRLSDSYLICRSAYAIFEN